MCNLPGPPWAFAVSIARWVGGGSFTPWGWDVVKQIHTPPVLLTPMWLGGGRGWGGGGTSSWLFLGGGKKILEFYLFFPKTKNIKFYK